MTEVNRHPAAKGGGNAAAVPRTEEDQSPTQCDDAPARITATTSKPPPPPPQKEEVVPTTISEEEALLQDMNEKALLVIGAITQQCRSDSPFAALREIGIALQQQQQGAGLQYSLIPQSKTNYSYKVFLPVKINEDSDNNNNNNNNNNEKELALFAKLCFPYARWNPDRSVPYPLERAENEFKSMQIFANIMRGEDDLPRVPVATTYLCLDLHEEQKFQHNHYSANNHGDGGATADNNSTIRMKLLVMEWVHETPVPLANQFVQGVVNSAIIPKIATAFAKLNLTPMPGNNKEFNSGVCACMQSMYRLTEQVVAMRLNNSAATETETGGPAVDACIRYLQNHLGQAGFAEIMSRLDENYLAREIYSHSDGHPFNILVEEETRTGAFVICDWEVSYCGSAGRDVGFFLAWPVACLIFHAAAGRSAASSVCRTELHAFYQAYEDYMLNVGGKNAAYMEHVLQNAMAWCGWFMMGAYYLFRVYADFLPTVPDETQRATAFGILGLTGLKFMEFGFSATTSSSSTKTTTTTTTPTTAAAAGQQEMLSYEQLKRYFKDCIEQAEQQAAALE